MMPATAGRRGFLRGLVACSVAGTWSGSGHAQATYPTRAVHLVVPTVGGTVDLIARAVAPGLSRALGQPVIVDQKAGASGNIAAEFVSKSAADGHTLLAGYNPLAISALLPRKLGYELFADLAPITRAVSSPQVLAVNAAVPAKDFASFVAYAKAQGHRLNYASISAGSASHLAMEMFKVRIGLETTHIPYKGAAPALTDLLGGVVQCGFFAPANVSAYAKDGSLRVLAVSGSKRLRSMPRVPALSELGLPDLDASIWIGFLAPARTPQSVIATCCAEIARVLRSEDVRQTFERDDFEVVADSPEAFGVFLRSEVKTWRRVVEQAKVALE